VKNRLGKEKSLRPRNEYGMLSHTQAPLLQILSCKTFTLDSRPHGGGSPVGRSNRKFKSRGKHE
jgi:hypothetical protein